MRVARLLERGEVEGCSPGGVFRTVIVTSGVSDEVDLLVEDAVVLGHGDRGEQHAEDVVAVRLDRRPWLLVGVTLRRRAARAPAE